ncbi:MAG: haloacid dehalogenase type II [Chloroflexota bacterium]
MVLAQVKALCFDVFGTVVDWRGSAIAEGEALGRRLGARVDWPRFVDSWRRDGYLAGTAKVRRGEWPWQDVDALHRRQLDLLLAEHGLGDLPETEVAHFNRLWHRLAPWPDAVAGLARLKARYVVAPLSNGHFALLVNLAKHAGLPWDCIFASDLFGAYKPDAAVYQGAARLLGLAPAEVMLVAAHTNDLLGARVAGLRTAFVARPLEWGPAAPPEPAPPEPFDVVAGDFLHLAEQLGA